VRIVTRGGGPCVSVPKLDKLPEPVNLAALKDEVRRRWGTIDLLDILKNTALRTGFTDAFGSVASREVMDKATLRHVRATYITRENLRAAIAAVVNATLEVRDPAWWGEATSIASDSKRFGSWDSNLMTEFHVRYGGYGVMIYWHVERNRLCIYSQLKSCSSGT
jgi:hypothetical protein